MSLLTSRRSFCIFVVLVLMGALRIVATYHTVAQTTDETPNIACGMEWLDRGTYEYGPFHPPLARVAMALGPYLHGLRSQGRPDRWQEGNAILHSRLRYGKALTLARLGILPFFLLAAILVWLWARRALGENGALAAVFLFTNMPAVLAHAGLATTDMALTAGVCAAAYAFLGWMERPGTGRAAVFGLALAAAVLAKFSALLFVPVSVGAILAAYALGGERKPAWPGGTPVVRLRQLAVSFLVAFLIVWAAYRFTWGRMRTVPDAESVGGVTSRVARLLSGIPLPAPQLIEGVLQVKQHDTMGHAAYLLGQYSLRGWWYFFPVAIALKTPLGFLLLAVGGLAALVRFRVVPWQVVGAAGCALGIVACCVPAHLNIGLRSVLAIYPMLAIVGAYAAQRLWLARRRAGRVLAAALLAWAGISTALAHPDYLAYFNEIAARNPERFLVDSDLDWGQDMKRLGPALRARGVKQFHMACMYSGDDSKLDLPPWEGLPPYQPVTGWVAISFTMMKSYGSYLAHLQGRREPAFAWLDAYQPVARVGRSILLYHIPEKHAPALIPPGGAGSR